MKIIIFGLITLLSLVAYSNVNEGSIFLKSKNDIEINFNYETSEFTPHDWKWSALKMVLGHNTIIRNDLLNSNDKVRIVLVNTCKNTLNQPACRNKIVEIDLLWDSNLKAFTYEYSRGIYTADDSLWLSVCCYWEAQYDLEMAIVINGQWLTDPVSQSNNFLLILN